MCIRDSKYVGLHSQVFTLLSRKNKKSYLIAYSLKEAVRTEINRMMADDIDVYKRQLIDESKIDCYKEESFI